MRSGGSEEDKMAGSCKHYVYYKSLGSIKVGEFIV